MINALDTDLSYVRKHTRLLTRAIEWNDNHRRRSNILRGEELIAAEGWLAISRSMQPTATKLHRDYIVFSRSTTQTLQNLIYSGIGIIVLLVLALAGFAFQQRNHAVSQKQLAEENLRIANARSLVALALIEMDKDPELSLLLSTKSVESTYDIDQVVLPLPNTVLRQSITKSRVQLTLTGHLREGDGFDISRVNSADYSPDGKKILMASRDQTAKIWYAVTGKEILTLTGHDGEEIESETYSPDGQRVVTASDDQTVKIWHTETGQELLTLTGHRGVVRSATYSPNGKSIITTSADQTVRLYTTDVNELLKIAKSRSTRQLTAREKERYGVLD